MQKRINDSGLVVTRLVYGFLGRCRFKECRRIQDEADTLQREQDRQRAMWVAQCQVKIGRMLILKVKRTRLRISAKKRKAATHIQRRLARGPQGRSYFRLCLLRRASAITLQCWARTNKALFRSTVLRNIVGAGILQVNRAELTKERRHWYRLNGASMTIFRYYNASLIRKKMKKILYWNRVRKFTNAQRAARGFIARLEYRRLWVARERAGRASKNAATFLQRRWRGYWIRFKVFPQKEAAKLMNTRERKVAKNKLLGNRGAHYYLRKYLRKVLRPMICFRYVLTDFMATNIQRMYRGFHGRRRAWMQICLQKVDACVTLWHLRVDSAAKIQRCNAGFMVRRLIIAERRKNSATLMQVPVSTHVHPRPRTSTPPTPLRQSNCSIH